MSGRRSLCKTSRDVLGEHLLVKTTAMLGPNAEMGDVPEAIHLNRLLTLSTIRVQKEVSDGR